MKPHPFTTDKPFNVEKYLDEQLAAQVDRRLTLDEYYRIPGRAPHPAEAPKYRGWAIRLDAWCTRQIDRVDWPAIDIWLGTIGGFALTGVVVWFLYVLADAWIQGRFSLGGN